jgi:thiol-disulfide isomerase/thioredoxin
MRITHLVIGISLFAVVLNGCAPTPQQNADTPAQSELETDFELVLYQGADVLGGESVKFSQVLAQGKPVVLIMWASSCPSCLVDMVLLERARADYDEVLFVGLHIGHFVALGNEEGALAFLKDEGITFPNGFTPDSSIVRDYEVLNTPSIYYFKPSGEILNQTQGLVREDALREHIDDLVAASTG